MKIGVVGHGSIGSRHARNLETLGHKVVVYDAAGRKDVSLERIVYDVCDAVVIATPSHFHEGPLRACIERGKHALIEKPISTAHGALQKLLNVADEKGLVIMMGNNLRLHPCVQQVKHWLAEGKAGAPIWASFICATQAEKYTSDGAILNSGAHEVDLALYFFGPGHCVAASTLKGPGDEMADFVVQHDSGVRSMFHLNLVTPHRIREFWIAGQDANIGVDLDRRRMAVGDDAMQAPGSYDDDYVNEMQAFVDRINGVFAPGATGLNGLETLDVLLAVRRKAGLM